MSFKLLETSNSLIGTGYAIAALVLFFMDRPLASATLLICSELCSICAAIYRTGGAK